MVLNYEKTNGIFEDNGPRGALCSVAAVAVSVLGAVRLDNPATIEMTATDIRVTAIMGNQSITIRTETETLSRISAIAKAMDRSRNWVVKEALEQYIDQHSWYIEGIQHAQKSLQAGRGVPHEEVMAEVAALIDAGSSAHETTK